MTEGAFTLLGNLARLPAETTCRDKTAGIILKSVYTSAGLACRDYKTLILTKELNIT
jgi:hypothetical protein